MDRWARILERQNESHPEDIPAVLAREGQHGPIVHAANRAAEAMGMHRGARIVDMRALLPDLRVEYADLAGDQIALQNLMLWARRWCPWTAMDGPEALILDTTGSDHLLGGEAPLLRDIETRLAQLGLVADTAIAPSHGAAWALARYGPVRAIATPDDLALRLGALPVKALRLKGDTQTLLHRLGLKTIGSLMDVPRVALARRFARAELNANPLMRLDQALGRLAEPIDSPDDPPRFLVEQRLPEPIQDPSAYLPALFERLCNDLTRAGFGARRVQLVIYRTDGELRQLEAATASPSSDPDHLRRLLQDKIEHINPGFGFDLIKLAAIFVENTQSIQTRFNGISAGHTQENETEIAKLVDRLTARLGAAHVSRPLGRDSHLPERRENWIPALSGPPTPLRPHPTRPARLLHPPEEIRVLYAVPDGPPAQFQWRRQSLKVARFSGPERIAPEWWKDRPGTRLRDYYRIEDALGRRFWIYREGVHGDVRRPEAPQWFIHGIFA